MSAVQCIDGTTTNMSKLICGFCSVRGILMIQSSKENVSQFCTVRYYSNRTEIFDIRVKMHNNASNYMFIFEYCEQKHISGSAAEFITYIRLFIHLLLLLFFFSLVRSAVLLVRLLPSPLCSAVPQQIHGCALVNHFTWIPSTKQSYVCQVTASIGSYLTIYVCTQLSRYYILYLYIPRYSYFMRTMAEYKYIRAAAAATAAKIKECEENKCQRSRRTTRNQPRSQAQHSTERASGNPEKIMLRDNILR